MGSKTKGPVLIGAFWNKIFESVNVQINSKSPNELRNVRTNSDKSEWNPKSSKSPNEFQKVRKAWKVQQNLNGLWIDYLLHFSEFELDIWSSKSSKIQNKLKSQNKLWNV